jgi:hypothetical protein
MKRRGWKESSPFFVSDQFSYSYEKEKDSYTQFPNY